MLFLPLFPSVSYFAQLARGKVLNVHLHTPYDKRLRLNRFSVAAAHGVQLLSVPLVKGRNQRTIIKDLKIDDSVQWRAQHLNALSAAYNRSAWWAWYVAEWRLIYERNFMFLLDLNEAAYQWCADQLGGLFPAVRRVAASAAYGDILAYISVQSIITPTLSYHQVFSEEKGFMPNMSIIDLLCNEGKQSMSYLLSAGGN